MDTFLVPSFSQKLSWAEVRLEELEQSIQDFRCRHPYRTRRREDGNPESPWIMEFTEAPDRRWPLMVGDVLYNLRATLEYLAGALNPSSARYAATFPVVREPVWDLPPTEGETEARTRARNAWLSATRKMNPEAVAILQRLQPTVDHSPFFHCLDLLSRLSNKDRHRTLLVSLTGLTAISVQFVTSAGDTYGVTAEPEVPEGQPGTAALADGATITVPPGLTPGAVAEVLLRGTTTQAIPMGETFGPQVVVPDALRQILDWIRHEAVAPLSPFLIDA
jgi:hypothetical protein